MNRKPNSRECKTYDLIRIPYAHRPVWGSRAPIGSIIAHNAGALNKNDIHATRAPRAHSSPGRQPRNGRYWRRHAPPRAAPRAGESRGAPNRATPPSQPPLPVPTPTPHRSPITLRPARPPDHAHPTPNSGRAMRGATRLPTRRGGQFGVLSSPPEPTDRADPKHRSLRDRHSS
jgi:hypothetical protein